MDMVFFATLSNFFIVVENFKKEHPNLFNKGAGF